MPEVTHLRVVSSGVGVFESRAVHVIQMLSSAHPASSGLLPCEAGKTLERCLAYECMIPSLPVLASLLGMTRTSPWFHSSSLADLSECLGESCHSGSLPGVTQSLNTHCENPK